MTSRSHRRRLVLTGIVTLVAGIGLFAPAAEAHPLGNLSVNHYHGLTIQTTRVLDDAVVDTAELPTAQARAAIDANSDDVIAADELANYGQSQCAALATATKISVDGQPRAWSVTSTSFVFRAGQASLPTGRLMCQLETAMAEATSHSVALTDSYLADRVGWHEIVAIGDGVDLPGSPVPSQSVSSRLETYPSDLLSSPLAVRSVTLDVRPPTGAAAAGPAKVTKRPFSVEGLGPFSTVVKRVNNTFNNLVGRRQLSVSVGLLAIGLALVLGASHAVLPGHGKTIMAAYIAGRQGSVRDAVVVGATVTATHTGGVLLLGLALTLSSALAGEVVMGWLGVISGLMIVALGLSILINRRKGFASLHGAGHNHGPGGHSHGPADHGHDHDHDHVQANAGHRNHDHSHDDHPHHDHDADHDHIHVDSHAGHHDHDHPDHHSHDHPDHPDHHDEHELAHASQHGRHDGPQPSGRSSNQVALARETSGARVRVATPSISSTGNHVAHVSRKGLFGMGIAGGLVPSPSALVVLLSAIALGRTLFGVVLVVAYGIGMAGTLTLAGIALVRVRDRYAHRVSGRSSVWAKRWSRLVPFATATLIIVVGAGLIIRSLALV